MATMAKRGPPRMKGFRARYPALCGNAGGGAAKVANLRVAERFFSLVEEGVKEESNARKNLHAEEVIDAHAEKHHTTQSLRTRILMVGQCLYAGKDPREELHRLGATKADIAEVEATMLLLAQNGAAVLAGDRQEMLLPEHVTPRPMVPEGVKAPLPSMARSQREGGTAPAQVEARAAPHAPPRRPPSRPPRKPPVPPVQVPPRHDPYAPPVRPPARPPVPEARPQERPQERPPNPFATPWQEIAKTALGGNTEELRRKRDERARRRRRRSNKNKEGGK